MIFQHTWKWAIGVSPHTGEPKTQTRRLVKAGDGVTTSAGILTGVYRKTKRGGHDVYRVGNTYAVQPGRGKSAIVRIEITNIRREDARDISEADARAEGFGGRVGFLQTWCKMHDRPALQLIERWFIRADIDGRGYGYPMPADITELLSRRPADRYQAWVLDFKLIPSSVVVNAWEVS